MGHRRRPKGPRSTWEPKLVFNADRAALPADPPSTDTAIPDAAVSKALETLEAVTLDDAAPEPGAVPARDDVAPAPAVALPEAALPLAALIPPVTVPPVTIAPPAKPVAHDGTDAADQGAVAPDRLGFVEIGSTVARYMRGEGEAAVAHMRALSGAGSPAELMRLQMGEVRRAADASLTCWSDVARKASRLVAFR